MEESNPTYTWEPLFSEATTLDPDFFSCTTSEEWDQAYFRFILIPAVLFIVVLSFFKKRKTLAPNILGGRPAFVYPVNFIDEYERRWAYASVFAIMSYRVLTLFNQQYLFLPEEYNDQEWKKIWGWTILFIAFVNVIYIGIIFYPLLECISLREHIPANVIGLVYTLMWITYTIILLATCPPQQGKEKDPLYFFNIIIIIPIFVSYILLSSAFSQDLYKNIKKWRHNKRNVTQERPDYQRRISTYIPYKEDEDSFYVLYVKQLLMPNKVNSENNNINWKTKLMKLLNYSKLSGFRYPPRIICAVVVACFCLFKLAVTSGYLYGILMKLFLDLWDLPEIKDYFVKNNNTVNYYYIEDVLVLITWGFQISNILACMLQVIFLFHTIISYKKNLRLMLQGKKPWTFIYKDTPVNKLLESMKYMGYQVAYSLYGFTIMSLLLFLVILLIGLLLVLPFKYNDHEFILNGIMLIGPPVLVGILIYIMQYMLAKYIFLQEKGKYLALNNRRVFHTASFFLFFFNIVIGLFSCLRRVLYSIVFGTILISRLDRCLLMAGFEQWDAGHKAYFGMMLVDVNHNHPVMKAFVELLVKTQRLHSSGDADSVSSIVFHDSLSGNDGSGRSEKIRRKRVQNRMWKALTLARNPSLVVDTLKKYHQKKETKPNQAMSELREDVMDTSGARKHEVLPDSVLPKSPDQVSSTRLRNVLETSVSSDTDTCIAAPSWEAANASKI